MDILKTHDKEYDSILRSECQNVKTLRGTKLLSKLWVTQFRISSVRDKVSLNRSVHQVEINKQN